MIKMSEEWKKDFDSSIDELKHRLIGAAITVNRTLCRMAGELECQKHFGPPLLEPDATADPIREPKPKVYLKTETTRTWILEVDIDQLADALDFMANNQMKIVSRSQALTGANVILVGVGSNSDSKHGSNLIDIK